MNHEQLIAFPPVPVRARHDGWTPGIQRRFILELARGHGPAQALDRVADRLDGSETVKTDAIDM